MLGVPDRSPNDLLGDGVDQNDVPVLSAFPYGGTAHHDYIHTHHRPGPIPI